MATLDRGAGPTGNLTTTNASPTDCFTGAVSVSLGETVLVEGVVIGRSANLGVTVKFDATASRSADGTTLTVSGAGTSVGGDTASLPGVTAEWVVNGTAEVVPRITGVASTTVDWIATSRYNKLVP